MKVNPFVQCRVIVVIQTVHILFCSDNVSLIYQCGLSFQWKSKSSQPFEVTLLLLSFFIAWIEAWFVDFRVLPQEGRARRVVEGESSVDMINKAILMDNLVQQCRCFIQNRIL